jgi:hypothetical protein
MAFFMCNCREAEKGQKSDSTSHSSDFYFDRSTNDKPLECSMMRSRAFPAHSARKPKCARVHLMCRLSAHVSPARIKPNFVRKYNYFLISLGRGR